MFAYGSNMCPHQMRKRCGSFDFKGVACLENHRLCFPRYSKDRDSAVASVQPVSNDRVWGVVYSVSDDGLKNLHESEGYRPDRPASGNAYEFVHREVVLDGRRLRAGLYIANPGKPRLDYKRLILEGAKHRGLPPEYVRMLEEIETA